MLNIVVPMAGRGSRFANAGYTIPKPLIPVGGKPMIQWVIDNVRPSRPHRFTFICLAEHLETYPDVEATLRHLCPGCEVVRVLEITEGAACTVLLAKDLIDNDEPLMIANADQFVRLDIDDYLAVMELEKADGLIMTFSADHPKWSYCRMKVDGTVQEVLEKQVVSNEATVGIYNFRRGRDFVRAAEDMIRKNLRVNNEFYVAPTYNRLIEEGAKVVVARTGTEYDGMFGLGTPEDLDFFLTTAHFEDGRVDGQKGEINYEVLSAIYARFFDQKNLAGISAMLASNFALEDPSVRLQGKEPALNYIREVFQKAIAFAPRKIIASGASSSVEFVLEVEGIKLIGVDVIEWDGRQIREVRAYLYEWTSD